MTHTMHEKCNQLIIWSTVTWNNELLILVSKDLKAIYKLHIMGNGLPLKVSHHKGHFTSNYITCTQKLSKNWNWWSVCLAVNLVVQVKKKVRLHFSQFNTHGNKSKKSIFIESNRRTFMDRFTKQRS